MRTWFVIAGLVLSLAAAAVAKPPHRVPRRVADKNRDGKVGPRERALVRHRTKRVLDKNKDGVVDRKERHHAVQNWRKYADRNGDGKVDKKEHRLLWKHTHYRGKVNTKVEEKFDANDDGWIGPKEARKMLHAKWLYIHKHGKAKVDTELEQEYDTNGNGWIDRKEAAALRDDLKEESEEGDTED